MNQNFYFAEQKKNFDSCYSRIMIFILHSKKKLSIKKDFKNKKEESKDRYKYIYLKYYNDLTNYKFLAYN